MSLEALALKGSIQPKQAPIDYVGEQKRLNEAQAELFKAIAAKDESAQEAAKKKIATAVAKLNTNKNPNASFFDSVSVTYRIGGVWGMGGSADPTASIILDTPKDVGAVFLGPRPLVTGKIKVKGETHVSLAELIKRADNGIFILTLQNPAELYDDDGNQLVYEGEAIPASGAEIKALYPDADITFKRIGLFDHTPILASSRPYIILPIGMLNEVLADLDGARRSGKLIYVHCWGGQERSVIVTAAYLITYQRMTLVAAMQWIKSKRSVAKGLNEQETQFLGFLGSYFVCALGSVLTNAQDPLTRFLSTARADDIVHNLKYVLYMDWEHTIAEDRKATLANFGLIMEYLRLNRKDYEMIRDGILNSDVASQKSTLITTTAIKASLEHNASRSLERKEREMATPQLRASGDTNSDSKHLLVNNTETPSVTVQRVTGST